MLLVIPKFSQAIEVLYFLLDCWKILCLKDIVSEGLYSVCMFVCICACIMYLFKVTHIDVWMCMLSRMSKVKVSIWIVMVNVIIFT